MSGRGTGRRRAREGARRTMTAREASRSDARAFREQLKALHAADLGYEMALSLVSFGSQKLGLTDDTAELRDLDDARLSIELLRALLDVLERQGAGAPAAELRDTLAQLQLGYAQAVRLAQTPVEAAAGEDVTGEQVPGEDERRSPTRPPSRRPTPADAPAEPEADAEPERPPSPSPSPSAEPGGSPDAEGGAQEGGAGLAAVPRAPPA